MGGTFRDRCDAGRQLASRLTEYAKRPDVVVIGMARGGVPVAAAVADRLQTTLEVAFTHTLTAPCGEVIGAVGPGGFRFIDHYKTELLEVSDREIATLAAKADAQLRAYLKIFGALSNRLDGKTVIIADDGAATMAATIVTILAIRMRKPAHMIVGLPVAAPSTLSALTIRAQQVVTVIDPTIFMAADEWYDDFSPVTDEHVHAVSSSRKAQASCWPSHPSWS